ncbi:hypothetical protein QQ045_022873 [Rhodiola kirilowii]
MFSVATILAIALFTYCLYRYYSTGKSKSIIPLPPGPSPWPIIGCLPQMLKEPNKYKWIKRLAKDLNTDILCIRIGNVHVIPVLSQTFASEFLKEKDFLFASRPKSPGMALLSHNYMGSLSAPSGKQWTKMRKMMAAELFSPAMHQWFLNKRVEEADNVIAYIHNLPDGIVDLRKTSLCYATSILKKLIFNRRYFGEAMPDKGPSPADEEHTDGVMKALFYLFSFGMSDFFPLISGIFDVDGKDKKAIEAIKTIEKYQNPIIEERINIWRCGGSSVSSKDLDASDMLDIMINLKNTDGTPLLSEAEIKGQINELLLAGIDNTSNSVEWSFAEMLNKPSIMHKAVEELDSVVGKERFVEESDIPRLKYIKAILIESFRLHPVQPFIPPHYATKDATVGGYLIPKGSHILISRLDLGRNPNVWEDALTFNPDRHIQSCAALRSTITDPDLGFLSFGVGRRACAAGTLGTSMTVMLLARLVQAFDWSLPAASADSQLQACEDSGLFLMASPLVARATPRLPRQLYLV